MSTLWKVVFVLSVKFQMPGKAALHIILVEMHMGKEFLGF